MSTGLLGGIDLLHASERGETRSEAKNLIQSTGWSPQNFAQEQIRGLVRQVFFSNAVRPVRQVVFSSVEAETDVLSICRRVGEALALETAGSIAVAGGDPRALRNSDTRQAVKDGGSPLRGLAPQSGSNVWMVSRIGVDGDRSSTASLHTQLGDMRREFEYSLVAAPPVGDSNEARAMAQFADGIILVLSARHTRRVTARKIKEMLQAVQARLLGTVLSDRVFPIPGGIYRRL
jgi:hypothetical protein